MFHDPITISAHSLTTRTRDASEDHLDLQITMSNKPSNVPQGQTRLPVINRNADTQYTIGRPLVVVPFTPEERARITLDLEKLLGPEYTSERPGGGKKVTYIEGWNVLNIANEVFGFDGWLSEILSKEVDFLEVDKGKINMGMLLLVRITLRNGTFHEDFGYGFIENARSKAAAFEKVRKEAYTDGLKRCLRCFGNLLGNCLYDKNYSVKAQKAGLDDERYYRDKHYVRQQKAKLVSLSSKIYPNNSETKATVPDSKSNPNHTVKPNEVTGPNNNTRELASAVPPPTNTKNPLPLEDDSFCFSDDDDFRDDIIPKESNKPDITKPELLGTNAPVKFVSAKVLEDLKAGIEKANEVPEYDLKFVSQSIKHTVNPHKLEPIKKVKPTVTKASRGVMSPKSKAGSPLTSSANPLTATDPNTHHGRGVGLPPTKRPRNE